MSMTLSCQENLLLPNRFASLAGLSIAPSWTALRLGGKHSRSAPGSAFVDAQCKRESAKMVSQSARRALRLDAAR